MGEAVRKVSDAAPKDTIVVTDVGQHQMFAARYCRYTTPRTLITSGGMGTMGYGLPAAVGAKLGCPDRQVVLFVGDGGLQMNIQELQTIINLKLPIKIFIYNNDGYLSIKLTQKNFNSGVMVGADSSSGVILRISHTYGKSLLQKVLPHLRRRRHGSQR